MKQLIALLLVLSSFGTAAAGPTPQATITEYLGTAGSPGDVFFQSREFDQFDYRQALRSAAANEGAGLATLLEYSGRASLLGEGAEDHATVLAALLNMWGDAKYSEILQSCSPEAVSSVQGFLEYAGVSRAQFPRTFAVVGAP